MRKYIRPGVLWRAIDPKGAGEAAPHDRRAVILLDEIDKADPDVPNNLLVAIGSLEFVVDDLDPPYEVKLKTEHGTPPPLIVITSNEERELPQAFLRRCVPFSIELPDLPRVLEIGERHFPSMKEELPAIAKELGWKEQMTEHEKEQLPSIAEFLDTVLACKEGRITFASGQPMHLSDEGEPVSAKDVWAVLKELTS